jgi:hypothetical protein
MPGDEGANNVDAMNSVATEVAILTRLQQVHGNTHVIRFHEAFETETEVVLIFECVCPCHVDACVGLAQASCLYLYLFYAYAHISLL